MTENFKNKALTEYFSLDGLKWQGTTPNDGKVAALEGENIENYGSR